MNLKKYIPLTALLLSINILFFTSCSDDNDVPDEVEDFDRNAMLSNIGNNIIIPGYSTLKEKVDALDQSVAEFTTNPTVETLTEVQDTYLSAYEAWQSVSVFEFGPAIDRSLRLSLNTFPTDTVQIKSNISSGEYSLSTASNIDAKGFPALDFLLYGLGNTHDAIVMQYTAANGAENGKKYLADLSSEMKAKVSAVLNGWLPEGENYIETFRNNTGSDAGSSLSLLANQVNFDWEIIKNPKIAIPLGMKSFDEPQPGKVEAYFSRNSVDLGYLNAVAIYNLYLGKSSAGVDGLGLDDYLIYLNAQEGQLSPNIKSQFVKALDKIQTLPEPLSETVVNNPAIVEAAYDEIQSTLVLLKTDMISALGVSITYTDNDGD